MLHTCQRHPDEKNIMFRCCTPASLYGGERSWPLGKSRNSWLHIFCVKKSLSDYLGSISGRKQSAVMKRWLLLHLFCRLADNSKRYRVRTQIFWIFPHLTIYPIYLAVAVRSRVRIQLSCKDDCSTIWSATWQTRVKSTQLLCKDDFSTICSSTWLTILKNQLSISW